MQILLQWRVALLQNLYKLKVKNFRVKNCQTVHVEDMLNGITDPMSTDAGAPCLYVNILITDMRERTLIHRSIHAIACIDAYSATVHLRPAFCRTCAAVATQM